jgi:hypothetical protein
MIHFQRTSRRLGLPIALIATVFFVSASGLTKPNGWGAVLKTLNQEAGVEKGVSFPFTHRLNDDLFKINEEELGSIAQSWEELRAKSRSQKDTRSILREKTNRFFHEKINALNQITLASLESAARSHQVLGKDYSRIAEQVLARLGQHPVAKIENEERFDSGGEIGFCFGRALYLHYLLLKANVKQSDIAKVFMLGQLSMKGQFWKFHVALLVRDSKMGFLVIDPIQKHPMAYQEWMVVNAKYEIKGVFSRARFYVTDPRKFLPSSGQYDERQLKDPILKNYFDALVESL